MRSVSALSLTTTPVHRRAVGSPVRDGRVHSSATNDFWRVGSRLPYQRPSMRAAGVVTFRARSLLQSDRSIHRCRRSAGPPRFPPCRSYGVPQQKPTPRPSDQHPRPGIPHAQVRSSCRWLATTGVARPRKTPIVAASFPSGRADTLPRTAVVRMGIAPEIRVGVDDDESSVSGYPDLGLLGVTTGSSLTPDDAVRKVDRLQKQQHRQSDRPPMS